MRFWIYATILVCGPLLNSCTKEDPIEPTPADEVENMLKKMTLREKVGQLFFIRPESLAGHRQHPYGGSDRAGNGVVHYVMSVRNLHRRGCGFYFFKAKPTETSITRIQ